MIPTIILCTILLAASTWALLQAKNERVALVKKTAELDKRQRELETESDRRERYQQEVSLDRAGHLRGGPQPLLGNTPVGGENWIVNAAQIQHGGEFAAAAIAYGLSRGAGLDSEPIERIGLRFALWWHGYDDNGPPDNSLDEAWRRTGDAPRLGQVRRITRFGESTIAAATDRHGAE